MKLEKTNRIFALSLIFIFCVLIFYISSPSGNTPYNYFVLLANAFLHGKDYITQSYLWLSELIPAGNNKFYILYPPAPAILALPFVTLFGIDFPQQYISFIVGASLVCCLISIAYQLKKDRSFLLWSFLFSTFGTILWYMSSVGSVWYLGQTTCTLFISLAILESITKKRIWLVSLFLGLAYLSRIHILLSLPFFIFILKDELKSKYKLVSGALILFSFILIDAFYNFIRFGVPWDAGYYLIPGVLSEPWFDKGIINPSYIPRNIQAAFWSFPKFVNQFPYIKPSWYSLAIWITSPVFIFSFFAPIKEMLNKVTWFVIILICLFVFMHGTVGFAQFGYRFAVDFYPFLFFLTFKGIDRTGLRGYHWLLLLASIVVNLWGILWINKFNWVVF